ncbi:MAG: glycosyltransferase [Candidatus Nanopelagicales bacterium]
MRRLRATWTALLERIRTDPRVRLFRQAWPSIARTFTNAFRVVVGLPRLAMARRQVQRENWEGVIRVLAPHVQREYPLARSARVLVSAYGKIGDFDAAYLLADRLARISRQPNDIKRAESLRGRVVEVHPAWLPAVGLKRPELIERPSERRVLYLAKESAPYLHNGFCTRSHETLRAVKGTGTEVVAVTMPGFPAVIKVQNAPDEVTVDDITYKHLLPNAHLSGMAVNEYLDLSATALARFVLEFRPTVLHIGSGHRGFETALVGRAVAEWYGIPWMYEVRSFFETTWTSDKRYMESAPYFHQRHATEGRCMAAADYVVTLSGPMRDEIVEQHHVPTDKVTGIPNAVDIDRFSPEVRDEDLRAKLGLTGSKVIGYVSNLSHPREGQEAMIKAVPLLKQMGIPAKALLVGDGARKPELEALARKLGVSDDVVFTGSIPFEQVSHYYAQIDLFVVPRTNERAGRLVSPMKPFEAMAMDIPLLVSDLPALVEIVEDEQEPRGRTYKAEDADDLARVAAHCLNDEAGTQERIRNAAAWVRRERTWSANGKNFVAAYEQAERRFAAKAVHA